MQNQTGLRELSLEEIEAVSGGGLLDGLLDAIQGAIDIVSPDLSKNLGGVLKPVLGGLLSAAEPNNLNK